MAINIRKTIEDPNLSAEKIIRLLSADPAISAQIIKTANSAAFSSGFQKIPYLGGRVRDKQT